MVKHEKNAFAKFFFTYFLSVALLILAAGHFYYKQADAQLIKDEHFSLIGFAKRLKMYDVIEDQKLFQYTIIEHEIPNYSIKNFRLKEHYFIKLVPHNTQNRYIEIKKLDTLYLKRKKLIMLDILSIELALLAVFAILSYFLAYNALKPLRASIKKLDDFSKDLIHDLNTPVTSMGLNIKLLEKRVELQDNKALLRLNKSLSEISELHQNLTILLQEETFLFEEINICELAHEVANDYTKLYPRLSFKFECNNLKSKVNTQALRQIIHNLLSNACKYNKDRGSITLKCDKNTLYISDTGLGIEDTKKIFERHYSEHNKQSGIGLDIVKRLCEALDIDIRVTSNKTGTTFSLTFN